MLILEKNTDVSLSFLIGKESDKRQRISKTTNIRKDGYLSGAEPADFTVILQYFTVKAAQKLMLNKFKLH